MHYSSLETFQKDCTVLVFYALSSDDADPTPQSTSLVALRPACGHSPFVADVTPYLTVLERHHFEDELDHALSVLPDCGQCRAAILQVRGWFQSVIEPVIGYELEPRSMAGLGTAYAAARDLGGT
ncbi:MAG: hypothetical protein KC561_06365 [Myxococcales bacterium]|nr:hypothetical protein [Myxococcales bacterium]